MNTNPRHRSPFWICLIAAAFALFGFGLLSMHSPVVRASPQPCSSYAYPLTVTPPQAYNYQSKAITITGVLTFPSQIYLGDLPLPVNSFSNPNLHTVVPDGLPAGTYDVWVNNNGTWLCTPNAFTVEPSGDGSLSDWTPVSSLQIKRYGHAVAYVPDPNDPTLVHIFALGGINDSNVYLNSIESAWVTNNGANIGAWQTLTSTLPQARAYFGVAVSGTYIYAIGGEVSAGVTISTVVRAQMQADGSLGSWTTLNNLGGGRSFLAAVAANGYIDVFGNNPPSMNVYNAVLNSNGSLGSWGNSGQLLSQPVDWPAVATTAGNIYVMGGNSFSGVTRNGVWMTNDFPASNALANLQSTPLLNTARVGLGLVTAKGYLYAIGGSSTDASGALNTVERAVLNADGTVGAWTSLSGTLAHAKYGGAAVPVGKSIYAIGGHDGVGVTNDVERAQISPLTLVSLSRSSATVFGSAFTLTMTGTNFLDNAVVRWNYSPLSTTFVDSTHLTAVISSAQLSAAGEVIVDVQNQFDGESSNGLPFSVTKADQAITFNALPDRYWGDPPFNITATSTSGLTVTFTSLGSCGVTGDTVTLNTPGACTISAHQSGNSNYNAAPADARSFTVWARLFLPMVVK